MSADATTTRYPKRKRGAVNYLVDEDKVDDAQTAAEASGIITSDNEDEDGTYGTRKFKKKRLGKHRNKENPKAKRALKEKPFPLMHLPAELRLKVYEEALVDPHGVHICTHNDRYEKIAVHRGPRSILSYKGNMGYCKGKWCELDGGSLPISKYQLSPNILAVSKNIHDEAVRYLWMQPFLFENIHGLHAFLQMLSPNTISLLQDITILRHGWSAGHTMPAFTLLRDAVNLRNLRLDCQIRSWNPHRRVVNSSDIDSGIGLGQRFYKDCHPFIKAFAKHRGIDELLQVVKFSKADLKNESSGRYGYVTQPTSADRGWNEERERLVTFAMRDEIERIINRNAKSRYWSHN